MPIDLRPFIEHLPAWLMVLFRLTGIFVLAPMLGSNAVPRTVRVFLVLGLSFAVYPMLMDPASLSAPDVGLVTEQGLSLWTLAGSVGGELLIGYAIGYAASLPLVAMQLGGYVMDQQMGLGLGGVFNPDLGAQGGVIGQMLFMLALAIFAIMGGHHAMFAILVGSFGEIPLGAMMSQPGIGQLVELVLGLLQITFELAIRIAAPLLCLIFLVTVAMGFIARTVPQMNILSVGFVIRIVAGVGILMMFIHTGADVYANVLEHMINRLMGFFAGSPIS